LESLPELPKILAVGHHRITSPRNRWLQLLREIRRGSPASAGFAALEGPILVREALRSTVSIEALLAAPEFVASPEARRVETLSKPVLEVDRAVLARCCDADSPQGLVAIAAWPPPHPEPRYDTTGWHVALDGLQDPGNVGALARVAEAADAISLILFPGTARASHSRALRASAGSLLRLPACRLEPDILAERTAGVPWIGLDAHRGDDLYREDWPRSAILVAGAEASGVGAAAGRHVSRWLRIPTSPAVESLNVATAVAVVLFELRRRLLA
jgi:TrmH family RNA methyltransferase